MEKTKREIKTFKVSDYGDMFAKVLNMDLIHYSEYGGYSGSWIGILKDEDRVFFYLDYYGSCSGCDWLEAERDWETEEVDAKEAIQYVGDIKPMLILPIFMIKRLKDDDIKEILSMDMHGHDMGYEDRIDEVVGKILTDLTLLSSKK